MICVLTLQSPNNSKVACVLKMREIFRLRASFFHKGPLTFMEVTFLKLSQIIRIHVWWPNL